MTLPRTTDSNSVRPAVPIARRSTPGVHGHLSADGLQITWTLPDPILVGDHDTIALIADIIAPARDGLEVALFIAGRHATACLTVLEHPRPRELEQRDAVYSTDGATFTGYFPHHWASGILRDAGIAGSLSVDGGAPLRFAGLLEAHRRSA